MSEHNPIQVPTDPDNSHIIGRNGRAGIKAVTVLQTLDNKYLYFDGIGKRGKTINGGLYFEAGTMDKLAMRWLEERGFMIPAKTS
jgi:hypothetical protein